VSKGLFKSGKERKSDKIQKNKKKILHFEFKNMIIRKGIKK